MSNFKPGDKVAHEAYGHGEITFGPFTTMWEDEVYLVRNDGSGNSRVAYRQFLTLLPAFAVGDLVTHTYTGDGEIKCGPFKATEYGDIGYLVEFSEGLTRVTLVKNLSPRSAEPSVGDRVRVTEGNPPPHLHSNAVGEVGELVDFDPDDSDFLFFVRLDSGSHRWVHAVEKI